MMIMIAMLITMMMCLIILARAAPASLPPTSRNHSVLRVDDPALDQSIGLSQRRDHGRHPCPDRSVLLANLNLEGNNTFADSNNTIQG